MILLNSIKIHFQAIGGFNPAEHGAASAWDSTSPRLFHSKCRQEKTLYLAGGRNLESAHISNIFQIMQASAREMLCHLWKAEKTWKWQTYANSVTTVLHWWQVRSSFCFTSSSSRNPPSTRKNRNTLDTDKCFRAQTLECTRTATLRLVLQKSSFLLRSLRILRVAVILSMRRFRVQGLGHLAVFDAIYAISQFCFGQLLHSGGVSE